MIKKVLGLLVVIAVMASCASKEQKSEQTNEQEITKLTVDEVAGDMLSHVDKEIVIKGIVNHVCSHGGKRMFIMGEDPDVAIKITPCEEIGVFEKELEGSHVMVTGVVKELRIDEAYVVNLEKEIAEGGDNEAIHDHSGGEHDEAEEANDEKKAQIEAMREKIATSENGYYSQFWVEASKFEVKEGDHDHAHEGHGHDHDGEHDHEGDHDHDHEHAEGEEHTH